MRPRSGHLFHRFGLMVEQFKGDRYAVNCNSRGFAEKPGDGEAARKYS